MNPHTPTERRLMLSLARLLDRVPLKRFEMRGYVIKGGEDVTTEASITQIKRGCGYTACALGWAVTIPVIRKITRWPGNVAHDAFGLGFYAEIRLFGSHRNVGPRQVARDLRRYLKTGETP